MIGFLPLIFITAVVAAPDSTPPAPPDTAVIVLPEVRVDRDRPLDEARRRLPTSFASVIPVHAAQRASSTLGEVLAEGAGVHVVRYGGLGAFSTVSLRGAPPGEVAVYLDGLPLATASHGVVNLSDVSVGALDRIEVYRGQAPLALGPGSAGGAINLVSAGDLRAGEASVTRGGFDTWEGRVGAGGSRGALAGEVRAGLQSSRGNYDYLDPHGTPFNPADDRVHPRLNNRFDAADVLATLRWRAGAGWTALGREQWFHKAQGLPGMGSIPALNTRLSLARSLSQFELIHAGHGPLPDVRVSGGLTRERTRLRDDGGLFGLGELGIGRHDTNDLDRASRTSLDLNWPRLPLGISLSSTAAGSLERADLTDDEDGAPDPPASERRAIGAGVGVDWRSPHEWITVHAARRWDRIRDRLRANAVAGTITAVETARELDSPQLGARVRGPWGFDARANWARAERVPEFLELFGREGSLSGNALLRPEHAENRDAGLGWSGELHALGPVSLEWSRYRSDVRDLILFWNNSPNTSRADNITSARIHGEEMSLRLRPLGAIALLGSVTWQSAIDVGPYKTWHGKRLPQRPSREAYLRGDTRWRALRASAELQFIGDNFLDRYNRYPVSARTLVGASLSAPLAAGARAVVECKNLGDQRASDVAGFPLPGRSLFATIEVRLGPAGSAQP